MQAVPLGFFLFLAEFAAGVFIVTALLDWKREVSAGYLFVNGVFALLALGAGLWLRAILPAARLLDVPAGQPWLDLEIPAWAVVVALGAVQLTCIRLDRRIASRIAGVAVTAASLAALAVSSGAYGAGAGIGPAVFAALAAGALAQGTVWSGMMLGHWYLVTPLLKPRPLLRLNASFAVVLVLQGVIALWALVRVPAGGLEEGVAWLYWLRVGVGVALPLALSWPIWRTARVRSMMSATGLLYIALGLVLAGEIIARAFYFVSGLPT